MITPTHTRNIKQIVACPICSGSGVYSCSTLVDYHNRDYEYWNELCSACDGEGRILKFTHTVSFELTLPNGERKLQHVENTYTEKLSGRKTEDIYLIGRKNG